MGRRQRLDQELVTRGLAASRQQAQQLIRAGRVRLGDRVLDKPGTEVLPEAELHVQQSPRFVSRGGEKLLQALATFPLEVRGRVCLDGGISTGGFSDCLLQHGAERVYGIDVGYGQTAWSLRCDPRLVLRERTNLRHLLAADLYGPADPWPDLAVADVSFISLALVLPALLGLLRPEAAWDLLLLVKPQFEVGKARAGWCGILLPIAMPLRAWLGRRQPWAWRPGGWWPLHSPARRATTNTCSGCGPLALVPRELQQTGSSQPLGSPPPPSGPWWPPPWAPALPPRTDSRPDPRAQAQMAPLSRSPVRMRITASIVLTKILPSPISPVRAAS